MTDHPGAAFRDRLSAAEAALVFDALSQPTRLEVYRLLLRYQPFGLAAGDIARLIAVPHNTLSSHLALLQTAGLTQSRREGRSIIFAAVPQRFSAAEGFLSEGLYADLLRPSPEGPAHGPAHRPVPVARPAARPAIRPRGAGIRVGDGGIQNVLVLCTGNSGRSILAEALINREGGGRFRAFSAGSHPRARPDPMAIELLASLAYDTSALRSKSWTEFARPRAPRLDFVITVCDRAAGETCPAGPGHPLVAHWGIPDPSAGAPMPQQKRAAFHDAYRRLMSRVTAFVNLPIDRLSLGALKARLEEIGSMDGATELARRGRAA